MATLKFPINGPRRSKPDNEDKIMDKGFKIENAVKTFLTAFILLVCWAVFTPIYAADGHHDRGDRFEGRLETINKGLSTEQVRDIVSGHIAQMSNTNLKVGGVTVTSTDSVLVDVITQDGSLVQTIEISTRTGRPADTEQRFDRGNRMSDMGPGQHRGRHNGRGKFGRGKRSGQFIAFVMGRKNHELALTIDQARTLAETRLILSGNDRLKVGSVEAIDDKTLMVEIVTVDGSLVVRRNIDRGTGKTKQFQ
jgi:hypothetical protein